MIRILSGSALTSNVTLNPSVGYKWIVQYAKATLASGATAGTRSSQVNVIHGTTNLTMLAQTGNQTSVSTNFEGSGSPSSVSESSEQSHAIFESDIIVSGVLAVIAQASLISGDTFGYFLVVNEVVNE